MEMAEVLFGLSDSHLPEELIERYAMKRATENEEEQVEEHLLICGSCREALVEAESWVPLMKQALPAVASAQPLAAGIEWRFPTWRSPVWGLGAAALAAVLIAVPSYEAFRQNEPISVALEAYRGAEAPVEVPAATPLEIRFAGAEGAARMSVVRASDGGVAWEGPAAGVRVSPLAKGQYWVRLFAADGRQTKEAGLLVK